MSDEFDAIVGDFDDELDLTLYSDAAELAEEVRVLVNAHKMIETEIKSAKMGRRENRTENKRKEKINSRKNNENKIFKNKNEKRKEQNRKEKKKKRKGNNKKNK